MTLTTTPDRALWMLNSLMVEPALSLTIPQPTAPDVQHIVGTADRHGIEILLPG